MIFFAQEHFLKLLCSMIMSNKKLDFVVRTTKVQISVFSQINQSLIRPLMFAVE